MTDTTTVHIEVDDSEEEVHLPRGVIEFFADEGQTPGETIGDLITVGCTQRLHAVVHHSKDEPPEEIQNLEVAMGEQFEERFGTSFESLLDHEH